MHSCEILHTQKTQLEIQYLKLETLTSRKKANSSKIRLLSTLSQELAVSSDAACVCSQVMWGLKSTSNSLKEYGTVITCTFTWTSKMELI